MINFANKIQQKQQTKGKVGNTPMDQNFAKSALHLPALSSHPTHLPQARPGAASSKCFCFLLGSLFRDPGTFHGYHSAVHSSCHCGVHQDVWSACECVCVSSRLTHPTRLCVRCSPVGPVPGRVLCCPCRAMTEEPNQEIRSHPLAHCVILGELAPFLATFQSVKLWR